MNLFKKITTGVLVLAFSVGMAGGATAQAVPPPPDSGDVTVEITSDGVLSVSISELTDLGDYPYLLVPQDAETGLLTIDAADHRGTAGGWFVTLSGTDFGPEFLLNNLDLTGGDVRTLSTTGHSSEAEPVTTSAIPVSLTPGTTVLDADLGDGAGIYQADYAVDLNIPAGTLVGTYSSTLTVTIAALAP